MSKRQWFTILAISYANVACRETDPARAKWLMGRAKRYMEKAA